MCLREDLGEAEEAEGGRERARGLRRPGSPQHRPQPAPRCLLVSTGHIAVGTRCGHGDPVRPGRSEKAKVSQAALPSFPNFAPCGGRGLAARRVPTAWSGVAERKETGRGRGRRKRERG